MKEFESVRNYQSFLEPVLDSTGDARIPLQEVDRLVRLGRQFDTVQEGLGLIVCQNSEGSLF